MNYKKISILILILCVTIFYAKDAIRVQIDNEISRLIVKSDINKANNLLLFMSNIYNDPKAKFALGVSYENGFGVKRDIDKAKAFYKKALDMNYKDAPYNLAMLAIKENNNKLAVLYLSIYIDEMKMYRENLYNAYLSRGFIYYTDLELMDKKKAFNDFKEVLNVDLNNKEASLNIGIMYLNGDGIEKNNREAFNHLKIAATANNAQAQYNLGEMFLNGIGVHIDLIKSEKWLRMSAENGFKDAACNLVISYRDHDYSDDINYNLKNMVNYAKKCVDLK